MAKWFSLIVFLTALLVTLPQLGDACESGNFGDMTLTFARLLMGLTGAVMFAIFSVGEKNGN